MVIRKTLAGLALSALAAFGAVSPALAQDGPDYVGNNPPGGGGSVSGTEESRGGSSSLPTTGADLILLAALGLGTATAGTAMIRATRKRRGVDAQ